MNLSRNQIIIIGSVGLIAVIVVLIFLGILPGKQTSTTNAPQIELKVWGLTEEKNIQLLIGAYKSLRPNVTITYSQVPETNYEQNLVDALAAGSGPDIFAFHNSWLAKHSDKIAAAPSNQFSLTQVRELFPKVAEQDFTAGGKIYALPLYIDTLALIYNKDIFDAKTIALPPKNWTEFQNAILKIRELNPQGQIVRPAAAIGGSEASVKNAGDLMDEIFSQFGNPKVDQSSGIRFDSDGLGALNFYVGFANPSNPYYTWSNGLAYSTQSMSEGKTAMIFGYNSDIPVLRNKNPYLNLGVSPMIQLPQTDPINHASYWGFAVSKQSRNPAWAWDFIAQTTANQQAMESYLKATGESPALRTLIQKYANDPQIGVFARQALTARSWQKPDASRVKNSFSEMIDSVLNGRLTTEQALRRAESEINQR